MLRIPAVKLNNGLEMPALGLSMKQNSSDLKENEIAVQSVKDAIDIGYRLFNFSNICVNQTMQIGEAIQAKIKEGVVKREELFIISEVWCSNYQSELIEETIKATLKNLHLDSLDLFLIQFLETEGNYFNYTQTWEDMEMVYRKNLARAIGVSNCNSKQIDVILKTCTIFPQINQIECHPYHNQLKLRQYCTSNGIIIMAVNPSGSEWTSTSANLLDDERIEKIARRYQKTRAQILLKYNYQLGNIVSPPLSNKKNLAENINILNFHLAPEDMSFINTFDCSRVLEI